MKTKALEMGQRQLSRRLNQWQLIVVIAVDTNDISIKFWLVFFVLFNLHPHHHLSFYDWMKNTPQKVKTGETDYLYTCESSYYHIMAEEQKMKEKKEFR